MATTILMAIDSSTAITERFHRARPLVTAAIGGAPREPGQTYQGFIKAMLKHQADLVAVQAHLRGMVRSVAGRHWTRRGWIIFTVDGTKIDCPRTIANEEAFGTAGKAGCSPQQLLTMLLHMGTGLPWAWRSGEARSSEREHLAEMIGRGELPAGALLVADAGYTGYETLQRLQKCGLSFLIRAGSNVHLLRKLGFSVEENRDTVYLWPKNAQRDQPPLVLRLIRIQTAQGREMALLTNVLDPARLSEEDAAVFYRMRWGIEVRYRGLKQTMERRKMRSAAPRQAEIELHSALIGLTLLGLLSVSGIIARGRDPRGWSMALALKVARRSAAGDDRGERTLQSAFARAEQDRYPRRRSKKARKWPHKKNDPLPGTPHIRLATTKEIKAAQKIAMNTAA